MQLDFMLSSTQSVFISDRHIQESIATASEVLYHLKESQEGVMIKLDFEKAFNNLDWNFLLKTFEHKKFSKKWINWIKVCLDPAYASILINNTHGNQFKVKQGLKQGRPLSLMLFILVVDVLDSIINRASTHGLLKGIGPKHDWQVINLYFANDTHLFCKTRSDQIIVLKTILLCFEAAFGLKINLQKSALYYIGQDPSLGSTLASPSMQQR